MTSSEGGQFLIPSTPVGILCPNTPAFLECIFGVAAAGAVQVGVNYRLKKEDVQYIFTHSEVDVIVVDREFVGLLDGFDGSVPRIIDEDPDIVAGGGGGDFNRVIAEGLDYDTKHGLGWEGLCMEADHEDELIALAYTSGTTARPKGVEFTHRGVYLAAMANVIESGLNCTGVLSRDRAKSVVALSANDQFPQDLHNCMRVGQVSNYLAALSCCWLDFPMGCCQCPGNTLLH